SPPDSGASAAGPIRLAPVDSVRRNFRSVPLVLPAAVAGSPAPPDHPPQLKLMRTRTPPGDNPPRKARALLLLAAAGLALAGCHAETAEAKLLRDSCEAGDAAACNQFASRLQKGQHVLRDEAGGARHLAHACPGGG